MNSTRRTIALNSVPTSRRCALSVSLVVLYHADIPGVHGEFLGVDVLIVVSGFVIANVLLRERASKVRFNQW
jgi:peptidoglycan/LPS O-acetylase OafA/YrhL